MKGLALFLIGFAGFVLVGDRIDSITQTEDGHQVSYENYCATKVAKVGNKWRVTLSNGETVEFTDPAKLRLDYGRPCQ